MPLLLSIRNINLALSVLLLTGCAHYNSRWNDYPRSYNSDPYAQSDIDELLSFGANMSRIPPSSRAETCRILLKRQKDSPAPIAGIQLHLMIGRLLSDACGDIPRILKGVASIPDEHLPDAQTQKLVAIHKEALKRLNNQSRKSVSLEYKNKSAPNEPEKKEITGPEKDENPLLREKLEAIRSMEKHLDQSNETNQSNDTN